MKLIIPSRNADKILLTLLALLAGALPATAQPLLYSSTYSTVNDGPYNVVAADVNGDGKLDLICANDGLPSDSTAGNTLTVLTNNGNGTFTFSATLVVGDYPTVTAADVNGDGKIDLITANYGDDSLTVLTNNGNGVFGSNATYYVTSGSGPIVVVAADVNGNGGQYLITANYNTDTLTVLTNNGNGVFGFNANYIVGNNPVSVVAADVNGDGKLDLICANQSDNTLTVLTNNGTGVFGLNATYTVGIGPNNVVAADVNGDHKTDLVCANDGPVDPQSGLATGDTLTVLTNNGNGKFTLSATLTVGTNSYVTAADMNGNNKIDLITASTVINGTVLVLTNNGNGVFGSNYTYTVGNSPIDVIAADLTGDGKLDLVTANNNSTSLTVLLSQSPSPYLSVQSLGATNVLLFWPSNTVVFGIQQNSTLSGAGWTGVTNVITTTGGTNQATISTGPGAKFFRLISQ